ncbi:MAG: homocysteine S-methyltransferase family protein [Verrucomicrobiales bacterium]|nr:homocysteine S-methyltransferase family protein [Verrucomicrobiales bacterium]
MHPTLEELLSRGLVLLDGAWGTELQARGLVPGECPDHWNLTAPERVAEVARAYVEAGSRVILTNTFGANSLCLAAHGLAAQAAAINTAGARISRTAAGSAAKVFGSMGPSGKMLMMGEVSPEQLQAAFAEQAGALATGGADGLVIETMADLEEAKLALAAARTTGLPVVVCMVYDSGKDKNRTMMGTTPEQAAEALTAAGADVIGSNCGQGVEGFVGICRRLRAATDLPIWIKANAGLPTVEGGKVVYHTSPEAFAAHLPALREAGAAFVGGCCGTNPAFVRALSKRLAAG